jgi:hypothetical protein
LGRCLSFIAVMPDWLSLSLISIVAAAPLLLIFKYTSNQKAIGKIRDNIKANMLALKLYKDSFSVTVNAQVKVFINALLLLVNAIIPMLVMIIPVSLLLAQMALWYQARPLKIGEEATVTMQLADNENMAWPNVTITSMPTAKNLIGPVKIQSKREICWKIQASETGNIPIVFKVDDLNIEKKLVIGNGLNKVSLSRPGENWIQRLLHPLEAPFDENSPVKSISIIYPQRSSFFSGSDNWVISFFLISLIAALLIKPILKVKL